MALVHGEFTRAKSMLAPELRREFSDEVLRDRFQAMYRGYAEGPARSIYLDDEFQIEDWPTKRPGDIGWVYVGIEGSDFVEAVTVVVSEVDGTLVIAEIEWGRP